MKILNNNFAKLILLCSALLMAFMLNSCMNYKKAKARYARTNTDTVTISKEVILAIPKDSVRYRFVTDTIPFYDEVRQGRATVRIQYKDKIVKIRAECDSATKTEIVTLKAAQEINTWGTNPLYEKGFFVLCGLFGYSLLHMVINQKRNNGTKP